MLEGLLLGQELEGQWAISGLIELADRKTSRDSRGGGYGLGKMLGKAVGKHDNEPEFAAFFNSVPC